MRRLRSISCLALVVLVSACANRAGIAEFGAFREAFQTSRAASEILIDTLAAVERAQSRALRRAEMEAALGDPGARETLGLSVDDAALWSTLEEPPFAADLRAAIAVTARFNTALNALATGQTSEALLGEVNGLVSASVGLAGAAGVTLGPVAAPARALARDLLRIALEYRSREVFRTELLAAAPQVRALLAQLRDEGAPLIFERLAREELDAALDAPDDARFDLTPDGGGAATVAALDAKRTLVSDWVVLMTRSIEALDAAVRAARAPGSSMELELARLTVEDMRRAADAVRRGVAAINLR